MRSATRKKTYKDPDFLAWMASLPCMVTGERPVTVHHVRFCGSARDDRRTVPLVARLHMRTDEKPGFPCVERGKKIFEQYWKTDLEEAIKKYNAKYEREHGNKDNLS